MIRFANSKDLDQMEELMYLSFGRRDDANSFRRQTDKYLVYIEDDRIVAMTAIVYSKEYKALEIGWTCTLPDYRGRGIMHKLFKEMLKDITERVYCSCWHLTGKEHINLYKLMKDFDFICITEARVSWCCGHNCHHNDTWNKCTEYSGPRCRCREDLYFRQGIDE